MSSPTVRQMTRVIIGRSVCHNGGVPSGFYWSPCTCQAGFTSQCCTEIVNCGTPSTISDASLSVTSTYYGGTATYTCNTHYNMTGGNGVRICQDDATWSGTLPSCLFANHCGSAPCQNGATCVNFLGDFRCDCLSGWSGQLCENDIQPPVMTGCGYDLYVNATEITVSYNWSEPSFTDPMGSDLDIVSNYPNPVFTFPWGDHTVQYVATKSTNGLSIECTFQIKVRPTPCPELNIPVNGAILCNNWQTDYGQFCMITCQENYTIGPSESYQTWYVCGASGTWIASSPVPDCDVPIYSYEDAEPYQPDYASYVYTSSCNNDVTIRDSLQDLYINILQSTAPLHRRKRFGWIIAAAIVGCILICRGGGGGGGGRTTIKYPPSFPEPSTPDDIRSNYNIDAGEDSVVVSWTEPTPTDKDGGTPSVTQVGGGVNGGRFDGATYGKTHYITYKAKDSDGLTGHCYFSFTVTELTCNPLSWPPNGARTCDNKNILGSSCHYTCNTGYQLTGSSTVTCENAASPSWSAIPTCEKITCSEPSYPEHTTVQCSEQDYGYLSVCSMVCDIGYTLKGAYFMQCQADRTWSNVGAMSCCDDSPPTISCVTPQIFYADRGVTSTSVTWQLPTASNATDDNPSIVQTYGPALGSVLEVGTIIVKYKAVDVDGSESQECFIEIRIEEITCVHPLDNFTDDYMRFNCSTPSSGYVYGTSCQLSCSAYLPLEGTDLITCEDNGQSEGVWSWGSGDKPYCREISCPELEAPINGALVYDTVLTRPLRIMCNDKFDIPDMGTNFNGQLLCTDDGNWTPFVSVPDCIEPRHPQFVKLPAEIFYYGGDCGDEATLEQIKENFQIILESPLNTYFAIVCPPGETCVAENIVVKCGPIQNRRKRSLSWTIYSRHLRYQEFEEPTREHHIEKRNAETHLLSLEFYIVTPLNLTNTTFLDAITYYDDIQLNILKPAIQDLINNGTFDIENFVLRSDSFTTPSYGDVTCDDGYVLDQTTCKPCPVGYYLNQTSNQCEQCPAGQYKNVESDSTCSSCPSGHTTQVSGSKSPSDCVKLCSPGTYSPNTLEICTACPLGYFQDEYGQTACKQCPSGTTTVSTNSSSASECKTFDACMSSPCNGNNCTSVQDSYICTCDGGWTGTNCATPPDRCNGNACENGASCISESTNYTCSCVAGYSGPFCEISATDGGWSAWTDSACSKTCGTGSMNRTRQCNSPVPDTHGADCVGDAIETIACNTEACPVCKELTSASGTLFNCSTDQTTGSETCTVYCEDGKVLPPGLNDEQSYTCGPSTNYEWDYLENPPSCVDPVGPGNLNISITVHYATEIPKSVASDFKDLINDQISGLQCFDSANCQTHIEIDQSTLAIVFNIPTSQGPDLDYSDYISSGIPNGALQEVIDAINHLEQTAQYIQNNTNELFDVTVDGVAYTVADNSLTIDAGVTCNSGFVASDGICVACPTGTHSTDDVCTFCEKGKYQSNTGQTTCMSCPDGQTTNAIGSTDSSQCLESTSMTTATDSTTKKPQTDKPSGGDDNDKNNTVKIAVIISVLALVIALAAIGLVCYKKIRPKPSVDCSTVNIRVDTARTRYTRSGRGTPASPSWTVKSVPEISPNDYVTGSDTYQTPHNSQYARVSSATSTYLTPDNISVRCYSPPPPYQVDSPKYVGKDSTGVDSTYAVIDDNLPIKQNQ